MSKRRNPQTALDIPSTSFSEPERSPSFVKGPAPSPTDAEAPPSPAAPPCGICGQPIQVGSPVKKLCCAHVLHTPCADQWLQVDYHCPICRTQVLFPVAQPATRQDAPAAAAAASPRLYVHAPKVVAQSPDPIDAQHYGVCRECHQVFSRDPETVRPDTLAWFRCPHCRRGDIRELVRSSCALM